MILMKRSRSQVSNLRLQSTRPKPDGLENRSCVLTLALLPRPGRRLIQSTSNPFPFPSDALARHSLDKVFRITDRLASHADLFSRLTRAHLRLSPSLKLLCTDSTGNRTIGLTAGGCRSVPPKRILFRSNWGTVQLNCRPSTL